MAHIDKYLDVKNGSLLAKEPLKIVLKKSDFNAGISKEVDDTIETFGIFEIQSLDGKDKFTVNFPLIINLNINSREEENNLIYLTYDKNNIIITRMTYIDGPKQANRFLDLLISGKFDNKSQEELTALFTDNMRLNGANVGVQSEIVEAMISELVRWKQDTSIPFRMKTNKADEKDYIFLSIKDVARASSVFNTLAFEDVKKSIQSSVLMSRKNTEQRISPVEKSVLP